MATALTTRSGQRASSKRCCWWPIWTSDRSPDRPLDAGDTDLLSPMITWSDNDAADAVDEIVGASGLRNLAPRVGMTHFVAAEPIWGESEITARDQTRFFLNIARYIVARHRAYALHLLESIVPSQRWGIGQVAPKGWQLYFKGGWGSGTGLIDNQVALLTRGCARISIAVLTMHDGSHAYGKQTLKVIFHDLLRGLPTGPHSRYPLSRMRLPDLATVRSVSTRRVLHVILESDRFCVLRTATPAIATATPRLLLV